MDQISLVKGINQPYAWIISISGVCSEVNTIYFQHIMRKITQFRDLDNAKECMLTIWITSGPPKHCPSEEKVLKVQNFRQPFLLCDNLSNSLSQKNIHGDFGNICGLSSVDNLFFTPSILIFFRYVEQRLGSQNWVFHPLLFLKCAKMNFYLPFNSCFVYFQQKERGK